jgi:hypothetical protein
MFSRPGGFMPSAGGKTPFRDVLAAISLTNANLVSLPQ